ncbi:MAG: 4-alpha-glucanotransferase [Prevotella sp.]|nr:4-alpha-glucanotransferase [Prevotella sp.]
MKLKFSINYNTIWGQSLHVVIIYTGTDSREKRQNLPMLTQDGCCWTAETALMESRRNPITSFSYYYQVEDGDGHVVRREWNLVSRVYAFDSTKDYIFPDQWRDIPLQMHLYSDAYLTTTRRQRPQPVSAHRLPLYRKTVVFRVSAPQLKEGESLAICGNHPAIGNWNPVRFLPMTPVGDYEWMLSVNVDGMPLPLEYKYVIVDDATRTLKAWEEGDNRTSDDHQVRDGEVLVLYGESLRVKEETWRAAGVVIPVFSLRSEHSFGVGDFGDLRRMVDWAVATGMKVVQVLPVNDTTSTHSWTDAHPYNAISAFALHPHYLELAQIGEPADAAAMTAFKRQRRELNSYAYCDYMAVDRVKSEYVDMVFQQEGAKTLQSAEYRTFFEANKWWLVPYAAFCVLRDKYNTSRFTDWKEHATFNRKAVEEFFAQTDEVQRICFVQYHLHKQLKAAADYARRQGVALKGDLAVGVAHDSVETWVYPQFFNADSQTGTPPDRYSPNGQNWAFPTWRWEAGKELFEWFHRRFAHMEQFFDAFRIDHVVGYFRTWEIPSQYVYATCGHFSPALPMSEAEIGQAGLPFRRELMTRPFVNDRLLHKIFGLHAPYVREHFLTAKAYGLYDIKPDYDTQVKVCRHFEGRNDENSLWIKEGLLRLLQNVLFVEDPRHAEMYHPRFGAQTDSVYEVLTTEEKDAFARLYNNYFYQRHNDFWGYDAFKRLSRLLADTRMLVCAEDLGMLPACVEPTLDALRILSLEVQDMPKTDTFEFAHLDAYPYRSVATFATHDMAPMRLWWEENPGRAQRYYATMMQKQGRAPEKMPAQVAEEIIARHLYCSSMLCMLSLQDWLAMDNTLRSRNVRDERINQPFDSFNPWRYRMHVSIEQLLKASQFNAKLKTMISRSKR